MAITKESTQDKIEVYGDYKILQIRTATVIKEDGVEISRNYHRHTVEPCLSGYTEDSDGKKTWTHRDTDISGESAEVQAIANSLWSDTIKANYKAWRESKEV